MIIPAPLPWQQVVAAVLDVFFWYMDQFRRIQEGGKVRERGREGEREGGGREGGR